MIHLWENYPIHAEYFDQFWDWIKTKIKDKEYCISKTISNEVSKKHSECYKWFKEKNILIHEDENKQILKQAMGIKASLGIKDDHYSTKGGVNEKDILIIATAKNYNLQLVTEEARQTDAPSREKKNYKIPLVCKKNNISYCCILDLITSQTKSNPN